MAYDRYDTRDERSRWRRDPQSGDRNFSDRQRDGDRERGSSDRGFFERAGDEVASWFGDDDAERRRREDQMRDERNHPRGTHERDRHPGRGEGYRRDRERTDRSDRSRPMTGDYGRSGYESDQFFAASGYGRGERDYDRSQSPWGRDEYRRTSRAGTSDRSDRSRHEDPHYESWRRQQMDSLDRDYDDYRREHQQRFESEFGSWREKRQQKRGLLGKVREHMEVVGNDEQHIGTVDRVAGDRLILTKSDPESGGVHHSLSCADIDRVEDQRVILDCSAGQARERWRDESRSRALFEREDQGEMGPRTLNRSFEGTYR
jgi:hypothetical protein